MAHHIRLVSVPVRDQDAAKSFYVDQVGFEERVDAPFGDGQRWVELGPKGSETAIALVTWFEKMPAGGLQGLVLETDDVTASREELQRRGVSFPGEIQQAEWGTFTTFADPDGNGWVLTQPPGGG